MDGAGAVVLRAARERAGLTQAQLGVRAGLPQSVVSAYERGRREPSLVSLRHLVAAAGFDLDVVLTPRVEDVPVLTGPVGRRVQRHRTQARQLLTDRGYRDPAVFGSVARGTDRADSDLDLLVDLPSGIGLTQLSRTAIDLETLLGVRVDLVPRDGLRARVAASIADELVML